MDHGRVPAATALAPGLRRIHELRSLSGPPTKRWMRATSKVAKFNFDEKRFIEILDVNKNDKIQLDELFNLLAGKMSIYFSIEE